MKRDTVARCGIPGLSFPCFNGCRDTFSIGIEGGFLWLQGQTAAEHDPTIA
jgi:hypothetical protein